MRAMTRTRLIESTFSSCRKFCVAASVAGEICNVSQMIFVMLAVIAAISPIGSGPLRLELGSSNRMPPPRPDVGKILVRPSTDVKERGVARDLCRPC
jgi:hypothetical protein